MERNQRFKDADWMNTVSSSNVVVGGVGGIGSWLTLYLARANTGEVTLIDVDDVSIQNLGGQFFADSQVNNKKVDASRELAKIFSGGNVFFNTINCPIQDINIQYLHIQHAFFACFDNMEARNELYNMWKHTVKFREPDSIFIDGRMLAEGYQITVVTNDEKRKKIYEQNFMQSDSEIPDLPCTMRATSHAASMLAGMMFGIFTNHCANLEMNLNYRDIPMFYEFDLPMMNNTILFPEDYEIDSPSVTDPEVKLEEFIN